MSRRQWMLLLAALPIMALFAILGWALTQTGGNPGGLGVNNILGEVQAEGKPAPHFTITSLDGTEIDPLSFPGKVVMIDFWSSWCPPCRIEAPILSQIHREYEDRLVEFIGIAVWDDSGNILRFVDDFNIRYPIAIDPKGRIAIDYGVVRLPVKYFMDGNGNLVRKFEGPMNPTALRKVLDELLAKEESTTKITDLVGAVKSVHGEPVEPRIEASFDRLRTNGLNSWP